MTWKSLHHQNVLPLLGATMDDKVFAMVSEWIVGGNINEYIKAHGNANRFELVSFQRSAMTSFVLTTVQPLQLKDVARGLVYMHDEGLAHGDLKGVNLPTLISLFRPLTAFHAGQYLDRSRRPRTPCRLWICRHHLRPCILYDLRLIHGKQHRWHGKMDESGAHRS